MSAAYIGIIPSAKGNIHGRLTLLAQARLLSKRKRRIRAARVHRIVAVVVGERMTQRVRHDRGGEMESGVDPVIRHERLI
jgi:hypothetical protein